MGRNNWLVGGRILSDGTVLVSALGILCPRFRVLEDGGRSGSAEDLEGGIIKWSRLHTPCACLEIHEPFLFVMIIKMEMFSI